MKIIVTGASGQVGSELRELYQDKEGYQFTFLTRSQLDITDPLAIKRIFDNVKPDACINCAAYTAVDKAETEVTSSYAINVTGPQLLASACAAHDAVFLHYSSDYVYHSDASEALKESDITSPKGIYAKHKLEGERAAMLASDQCIIIRTSWVYSYYGHNFVKTMLKLGKDRDELSIVADQIGTPTYAKDIASISMDIIKYLKDSPSITPDYGIYNFSNAGHTNWAEFATTIFEMEDIQCKVNTTTTEAYGAPAPRPLWSVLSNDKIRKTFGIEAIHWKESLKDCLNRLNS